MDVVSELVVVTIGAPPQVDSSEKVVSRLETERLDAPPPTLGNADAVEAHQIEESTARLPPLEL